MAAALTTPDDGVAESTAEWQRRRDVLMREFEGLPVIPANGGWSLLMDTSKLGFDSATASRRLMDLGRIAATPMANWAAPKPTVTFASCFQTSPASAWLESARAREDRFSSSGLRRLLECLVQQIR